MSCSQRGVDALEVIELVIEAWSKISDRVSLDADTEDILEWGRDFVVALVDEERLSRLSVGCGSSRADRASVELLSSSSRIEEMI